MTSIEERPTIGERYSSATESSNLKVSSERRGDVDMMIAAGWVPDTLGALLYRLRVEFDACDLRTIRMLSQDPPPERITALAVPVDGESKEAAASRTADYQAKLRAWVTAEGKRVKDDFESRRVVAKALAMVHMKSLPAAVTSLGQHACIMATRTRFMQPDAEVHKLVGRVIDAFLDPLCHQCEGRGFNGGGRHEQSGPRLRCRACRESGKRLGGIGRSDAEVTFVRSLLADMEERMTSVEAMMGRFLRSN